MKTMVVLISLSVSLPAAAYEVIFHQGFEGDQFPPEGWTPHGQVEHSEYGYDWGWCARLVAHWESWAGFESVEIPISPGELYEFRFHGSAYSDHNGVHYAHIHFNNGGGASFDLPTWLHADGYGWTLFTIQESAPSDASTVYFYFSCTNFGGSETSTVFSVDNVSIIHTATSVTPASLGHIKAAYR